MKKYLFYFGYIGTRFRGIQKQKNLGRHDSITGCLEQALLSLSPSNKPIVYSSSRTDAGVHAICSTFHSELCLPPLRCQVIDKTEELYVTSALNEFFKDSNLDIRIHKTQIVPNYFHSRTSALQRTYLYRLVHSDQHQQVPLLEVNRCQAIIGEFDVEAVQSACQILKGHHDFNYFTKIAKNEKRLIVTERTLEEIKIVPGEPLFNPEYDALYENFRFWNIVVTSRSFLYNQVRRLVALLVGVGKGVIDLNYVETVLSNPNSQWLSKLTVAKPEGLYLVRIDYPPLAFQTRQPDANKIED